VKIFYPSPVEPSAKSNRPLSGSIADARPPGKLVVTRFLDARITPLELSGVKVGRRPAGAWVRSSRQNPKLERLVEILRKGKASLPEGTPAMAGVSAVVMTGGAVVYPLPSGEDVAWMGEAPGGTAALDGPWQWLLSKGYSQPLVCDLGQTALKIRAGDRRWRFPRNFNFVSPGTKHEEGRSALRRWVTGKIVAALSYCNRSPDAVFFALPCRVNVAGVPGPCSYAGMADDSNFVPDVLVSSVLPGTPIWCANDAEAAAMGVLLFPSIVAHESVLVLTLGFSLGAALIQK
jgi:hypothetical protein